MRAVHAMMEGEKFENIDQVNAKLTRWNATGRIPEMANAWMEDDPKWRAQELAYDALETGDLGEALRLINAALKLDPDCTDANRLMVSLLPTTLENKLELMRQVVEKAELGMGPDFMEANLGHFWGMISTRPYMRAKQHLGELFTEAGDLEAAIAVFERMLELNPNDNQAMRHPLLGLYLATNQADGARGVMSRYAGEENFLATVAWARVLERWLAGEFDEAEAALLRARKVNPFAERYISGERKVPQPPPEYFRPGEDSEAQICAAELALAWQSHPAFRKWLRARR